MNASVELPASADRHGGGHRRYAELTQDQPAAPGCGVCRHDRHRSVIARTIGQPDLAVGGRGIGADAPGPPLDISFVAGAPGDTPLRRAAGRRPLP
jgi:hypothetical protein